jgi:hypothetical protein
MIGKEILQTGVLTLAFKAVLALNGENAFAQNKQVAPVPTNPTGQELTLEAVDNVTMGKATNCIRTVMPGTTVVNVTRFSWFGGRERTVSIGSGEGTRISASLTEARTEAGVRYSATPSLSLKVDRSIDGKVIEQEYIDKGPDGLIDSSSGVVVFGGGNPVDLLFKEGITPQKRYKRALEVFVAGCEANTQLNK